jgi:Do/DeqQ family serine protease
MADVLTFAYYQTTALYTAVQQLSLRERLETKMSGWIKASVFLAGSVVGGLAAAFLIVLWRPDLLPALRGETETTNVVAETATSQVDDRSAAPTARSKRPPPLTPSVNGAVTIASYAPSVSQAAPAVVNIYTARVITERVPGNFWQAPLGELIPRYRRRVQQSLGSGVIVNSAGQVVTNHHVIQGASSIQVQLADSRIAEASVIGSDPDTDLALLKIELDKLPVIQLGRSDFLQVGDVVLAIGNPIGLSQTVTQGIVSATGRDQLGISTFENFIQTDAPINFGNSGGALINTRGELVGINTAVLARDLGVEGIGFAIPVNLVRGVIKELVETGRVIRGWLGASFETLDPASARALNLPEGGVRIVRLYNGGPAQRAGLRPGDILLSINDTPVTSDREALLRIASTAPGTTLTLQVQRANQRGQVEVAVVEAPRQPSAR